MTNTCYCRSCKKIVNVVGFKRDNPVLSCGHTKKRSQGDDKLDKLRLNFIPSEDLLIAIMGAYLATRRDAINFCPVCDAVVSVIEVDGKPTCGGNLVDNPGCGCAIKPMQERIPTPLKCG